MFPRKLTMHDMPKRDFEYYKVNRTLTKRYLNSAVPQMQRILNVDKKKKIKTLRQLSSYPVGRSLYQKNDSFFKHIKPCVSFTEVERKTLELGVFGIGKRSPLFHRLRLKPKRGNIIKRYFDVLFI